MHAEVGDEIVVRGRHVGDEDRKGVITEVHGRSAAVRRTVGQRA